MFRPALPDPLQSVLQEVRLWGDTASADGAEERVAWVAGLRQLIDAAESVYLQMLGDVDANGDAVVLHGARSTSSWLQGALHLAPGEASSHARVARAARGPLSEPLTDLRGGLVTSGHLAALERSIRHLPPAAAPEAVELLGELAKRVDVGRLRTAGRALQHAVDPDGGLRECEKQFERRYLQLSPLLDGMVAVDGLLDPEGAAVLDAALAPFLVPAGHHDVRTTGQRRADGLVDVARSVMSDDRAETLGGQPVQMQVLVPWQVLTRQTPATGPHAATQGMALLGQSPREAVPLSHDAAERLGCGAAIARLVFGPDGVPLDLGRSQRLFSPSQRRALAIRDGGCRFPGCTRPPRFTDAHHIVPWSEGGASDLANALLLCRYHHRLVHEGGWLIEGMGDAIDGSPQLVLRGPAGQRLSTVDRAP
ncbi:MAG: HNH endonuclease [Actinomycetia bacterium]|nr:HNH endonuclease [Actinomycetes bacterium]